MTDKAARKIFVLIASASALAVSYGCGGSKTTATAGKAGTVQAKNSFKLEKPYFILLADEICKRHDLAAKKLKLVAAGSIREAEENHRKLMPVFKGTVERFDQIGYPSGDEITTAFAYVDEWRKSYRSHTLALKAAHDGDRDELLRQESALAGSLKKRRELSREYGFNECDSK